jgi:uncharacterized membrane protein YphA (DoxX/SURF4 family)
VRDGPAWGRVRPGGLGEMTQREYSLGCCVVKTVRAKLRRAPTRIATGAFVLNAGIGKLSADEETAQRLHAMASGTYPFFGRMDPRAFAKALALAEIAVGGALLLPIPARVAGLGLTAFAAGLMGLYLRTPGMRLEGSIRPSQQGTAIAKDVWLLGSGLSLFLDRD